MSKHTPPYPNAATDPFNQLPGMNRPTETMTAEPDLLPLPAPDYLLPLGPDHDDISMWSENTIRQIVAHATAAKDAEIEALRAEVERLQSDTSFATAISSLRREKERAERLAEALRKIAALTEEFDDLDDAVGIANEALEREAGRG